MGTKAQPRLLSERSIEAGNAAGRAAGAVGHDQYRGIAARLAVRARISSPSVSSTPASGCVSTGNAVSSRRG
jgi:hypothetical protein